MAELSTDRASLDEYVGVWFRSEVPDAVELRSMARLKENHAEDLEQLGILNVVVARMYVTVRKRENDVAQMDYEGCVWVYIWRSVSMSEKFFDATAMNVQSAHTKDVADGYVFNSTPMDSYGMPATRANLIESGVTSDGSPKLINDIEAGKHDELLSGMTNDDRMETIDALVILSFSLWTSIPSQHPMLEPGASAKDQPKVNSNFCTLVADPVFDGVNISIPRKVVKKGKSSFAWCLIEINSEANFVDVVTIGILSLSGYGFTKETIRVEYE
nr:zinc knuckle CX2CX4HX4C [Tanacetum cinerariifolium]